MTANLLFKRLRETLIFILGNREQNIFQLLLFTIKTHFFTIILLRNSYCIKRRKLKCFHAGYTKGDPGIFLVNLKPENT